MAQGRRGRGSVAGVIFLIGGSAAAVLFYQFRQSAREQAKEQAGAGLDTSGFDLGAVAAPTPADFSAPSRQAPSGLGLVTIDGSQEMGPPLSALDEAGLSLKEAARRSGGRVSAYTARFRDRHPEMREYSRQWMRDPDLKRLNDEYFRDRDPLKFAQGLAASPSLGPMVKKFAADPKIRVLATEFVQGVVKEVPSDLMAAATSVLNEDKVLKTLLANAATAVGVPPALVAGFTGVETVDQKAAVRQLVKDAPGRPSPVRP